MEEPWQSKKIELAREVVKERLVRSMEAGARRRLKVALSARGGLYGKSDPPRDWKRVAACEYNRHGRD